MDKLIRSSFILIIKMMGYNNNGMGYNNNMDIKQQHGYKTTKLFLVILVSNKRFRSDQHLTPELAEIG